MSTAVLSLLAASPAAGRDGRWVLDTYLAQHLEAAQALSCHCKKTFFVASLI